MRISRRIGNYSQGGRVKAPLYTGNYTLTQVGEYVYMHLLSSGVMELQGKGEYDLFAVGGGGRGGYAMSASDDEKYSSTVGGGGSGYTFSLLAQQLQKDLVLSVVIGAGAVAYGARGGATSIGDLIKAEGGYSIPQATSKNFRGANGGSGGGGGTSGTRAGNGGSDGSNGATGDAAGGIGQGFTTRAFCEADNTLYAGGGGGGMNGVFATCGIGGAGGGGDGGRAGATNTGSGGGGNIYRGYATGYGGSGLAIIRWKGKL